MTTVPLPQNRPVRSALESLFPPQVSVRKIVMPVEHGGWGILLEPVVFGLIAFPSWGGVLLGICAVAAFFARQPLKIAAIDLLRGKPYPRTRTAMVMTALFGIAAAAALAAAGAVSGWTTLLPMAVAAPLALVQIVRDARNDSRSLLAELSGTVAMTGVAAAMALAAGAPAAVAAAVWIVMMARHIPAILYIRARVRKERGLPAGSAIPAVSHVAALAAGASLASAGLAPAVVIPALAALFGRCAFGLSRWRRASTAKRIGYTEVAWGTAATLVFALGYALM